MRGGHCATYKRCRNFGRQSSARRSSRNRRRRSRRSRRRPASPTRQARTCWCRSASSATARTCGWTSARIAAPGRARSIAWSAAARCGRRTRSSRWPIISAPPTENEEEGQMRELVARFLSQSISRRSFLKGLTTAGVSLTAAREIVESLVPAAHAQGASASGPFKLVEGTGAECFAEQLIASGVKYVFGNSASEDAHFYEALVDRPQLKYILTPHEGPGAAMAAGYVKASGEPTVVMQAAVVGLVNAMGQMFNAYKEQTPLVFYSYRTDQTGRAGRDGFEEVANQEQIVQPMTKYAWLARRPDMIPETVRRAFKAAWTPPHGPTYASWHSDFNDQGVRTEIIPQDKVDPRMRVRPNPQEVERAAKMLVEAKMPVMLVGDEVYNTRAVAKAVKLAELLGMPVTQPRQMFANFPETNPLWVGTPPAARLSSLDFPKNPDVVLSVGKTLQHNSPAPIVARGAKFIDMRIHSGSMGNIVPVDVPLVCDVSLGLDHLISAISMKGELAEKAASRSNDVRRF